MHTGTRGTATPIFGPKYAQLCQITAKLISLKIIELNRVSIFFHEIFRINVELPDDLKSWSGILS